MGLLREIAVSVIQRVRWEKVIFPSPRTAERPIEKGPSKSTMTETSAGPPEPPKIASSAAGDIATACVACSVNHFSTSSGLLKEALRFQSEGMTSNEILDRVATALEEQNALEREDLTPEKIQRLPDWERGIADEALSQSRQLRHRLEGVKDIDELKRIAADTRAYYLRLSRQWYRGRFDHMTTGKADLAEYFEEEGHG